MVKSTTNKLRLFQPKKEKSAPQLLPVRREPGRHVAAEVVHAAPHLRIHCIFLEYAVVGFRLARGEGRGARGEAAGTSDKQGRTSLLIVFKHHLKTRASYSWCCALAVSLGGRPPGSVIVGGTGISVASRVQKQVSPIKNRKKNAIQSIHTPNPTQQTACLLTHSTLSTRGPSVNWPRTPASINASAAARWGAWTIAVPRPILSTTCSLSSWAALAGGRARRIDAVRRVCRARCVGTSQWDWTKPATMSSYLIFIKTYPGKRPGRPRVPGPGKRAWWWAAPPPPRAAAGTGVAAAPAAGTRGSRRSRHFLDRRRGPGQRPSCLVPVLVSVRTALLREEKNACGWHPKHKHGTHNRVWAAVWRASRVGYTHRLLMCVRVKILCQRRRAFNGQLCVCAKHTSWISRSVDRSIGACIDPVSLGGRSIDWWVGRFGKRQRTK